MTCVRQAASMGRRLTAESPPAAFHLQNFRGNSSLLTWAALCFALASAASHTSEARNRDGARPVATARCCADRAQPIEVKPTPAPTSSTVAPVSGTPPAIAHCSSARPAGQSTQPCPISEAPARTFERMETLTLMSGGAAMRWHVVVHWRRCSLSSAMAKVRALTPLMYATTAVDGRRERRALHDMSVQNHRSDWVSVYVHSAERTYFYRTPDELCFPLEYLFSHSASVTNTSSSCYFK